MDIFGIFDIVLLLWTIIGLLLALIACELGERYPTIGEYLDDAWLISEILLVAAGPATWLTVALGYAKLERDCHGLAREFASYKDEQESDEQDSTQVL